MSPIHFKCAYCGSEQNWTGAGAPVCSRCGATQPAAKPSPAAATARRRSAVPVIIALIVIGAAATAYVYKHKKHASPAPVATAIAPGVSIVAPPVVGANRITRVDNPHIRVIPKGAEFTAQDLLDSANRPPAPTFDPKFLVIKTPRRMRNEEDDTVFLGEVTNTSPDQVAVAPVATLNLTRGGREVDSAEHDFPDLPPGAHVPVFFRYDGEPKAFDTMNFAWKPTQSYTAADPQHAQLVATVATHEQLRGDTTVNFTQTYRYNYIHVTGTIANKGGAAAKNVRLYVTLRDAEGDITGYERQDVGAKIAAGGSADFEASPVLWGGPVASIEAVALPTSPPGF
jgi:hypothetical protein